MDVNVHATSTSLQTGPTDSEFALLRDLIHASAGIRLNDTKRPLLSARLSRRIRELELPSFGAYYRYVKEHGEDELRELLDCITTHETHFFREPAQFSFLEREVVPAWHREGKRSIRVWSAGCSSGEEPYSIAMLLDELAPERGWNVDIVATDLSRRVLARASEAEWPIAKSAEISERRLKAYMLRGVGAHAGKMRVTGALRAMVHFTRLNLADGVPPPGGPFDLIFCRNVLIYFSEDAKRRAVDTLLRVLDPEGFVFFGHAESLVGYRPDLQAVGPTIYAPRTSSARRSA
jgi:chemotaxis protein methyltransferase CheR